MSVASPMALTLTQALMASLTTTASNSPVYSPSSVLPSGGGSITPQSNVSGTLMNLDQFRVDPLYAGIDGTGFATVVLDTGIDLDHSFFGADNDLNGVADRIVYQYDYAHNDTDATDYNGHGSNVTSIVASEDGTYTGVAPGADIIHLKVFQDGGAGNFGYVEQALQWVVANAATFNIASVNMSLGDTLNHASAQSLYGISDELAALDALDVIVVSSSGNSFYGYSSVQGVGYPAADPFSLSVGAVYDSNAGSFSYGSGAIANSSAADAITPFSQRHQTLTTIFAPGAPITGAGATGGTTTMHGTSQASPQISGIATLAQQLAVQALGQRLTVSQFTNLVTTTAVTINDGDDENDNVANTGLNFGRVDVKALGDAILAMAGPQIQVLDGAADIPDDSGSIAFGNTPNGQAVLKTFTVKNVGSENLTLNEPISVPAGFSLASSFGSTTLTPGQTTTFGVQMDAAVDGNPSGQISFTNNDGDESPFNFTVSGSVFTPPVIQVMDDGASGYGHSGNWKRYTGQGHQNDVRSKTAGNGSDVATWTFDDLSPGQYRVSATWSPYSNRATDAPYSVLDGATPLTTVNVNQKATPNDLSDAGASWEDLGTALNVNSGTLVVQLTNDANGYVIADAIRIERIGTPVSGPEVAVLDGAAGIADDSGSVDFGTTAPGAAVVKTFTVSNTGNQDLTLTEPINVPAGFSLVSSFGSTTLAAGQSTTFQVQLDAVAESNSSGQLSFANNDADESPFNFTVNGIVATPAVVQIIDNGGSGFGKSGSWSSVSGQGHQNDVHFSAGGSGADLATWTFTGLTAGQYRVSATWSTHSNRASDAPFSVFDNVTPLAAVAVNQELTPNDLSDAGSNWEDVGVPHNVLSGTLVVQLSDLANQYVIADAIRVERLGAPISAPEIQLLDGAVDVADDTGSVTFGTTAPGSSVVKTFTVNNVGNQDLTLTEPISVPTGFTLVSSFGGTTLSAGQSTTFGVQLDAVADGSYAGEVSFANNDGDESPFNFAVSGTVATPSVVQIIDNGASGFGKSGKWTKYNGQGHQNDVHYSAGGSGADLSTWTFTGLTAGQYRVSATWYPHSNRATDAPFTVLDGATPLATVDLNQELAPNDLSDAGSNWEDVGAAHNVTGSTLVVQLSDDANQYVIADAIRIERVGNPLSAASVQIVENGGGSDLDGQSVVDFGIAPQAARVARSFTVTNTGTQDVSPTEPVSAATGFSVVEFFGSAMLSPGQSTTFSVQMDALSSGSYGRDVTITLSYSPQDLIRFTVP